MKIHAISPLRRVTAAQSLARRALLSGLGGAALLLAACASTTRSAERYVVLESQGYT